jgi:hypothetical protein
LRQTQGGFAHSPLPNAAMQHYVRSNRTIRIKDMTRILNALRTRFSATQNVDAHMAVHTLSDEEFAHRNMRRTDVARMIMTNSAW